ncbi:MAG: hypothetical protein KAJ19_05255, partial [Gammaproteobacteria bacterium]|nr:hypothetical protein [Gammaproteobacteria bacterium]
SSENPYLSEIDNNSLNIGICWSGNPEHRNDKNRSIPLRTFKPLTKLPNTRLYSLQKGVAAADISGAANKMDIVDFSKFIEDFTDTARIIQNLDLIITVDTAVAHLAGAMGKPVWVLLPYAPDWRWGLENKNTPWYPSMQLYRQHTVTEWTDIVEEISEDLRSLLKNNNSKICCQTLKQTTRGS